MRNVKLRHYAQIHFKLAIVAWMVLLDLYTPALASAALGGTVLVLTSVTIIGAAVASIGVIMSCQPGPTGRKGLGVEIAGLYSMMVGPFLYFVTQIVVASTTPNGWAERGAFVAALWVIAAAVLARAGIVTHRWRSLRAPRG